MTQKTAHKKSTIISDKVEKQKSDPKTHYVDNQKFFTVLIEWQAKAEQAEKDGKPLPRAPNYIGECIMKICQRLSTLHYFRDYTYVDELVLNAIENCSRKLRNFNPAKTANPFAYFTQIAYYSFIGTIETEKEEAYVKYKAILNALTSSELADNPEDSSAIAEHSMDNVELQIDHLQDYIKTFETKKFPGGKKTKKEKVAKDSSAPTLNKEIFE